MTCNLRRRTFLTSAAALAAFGARAQGAYPNRPVRMVIPFAAGGATDVLGRDLAQAMTATLGQSFVVENMGGGAGVPALNTVARSPADGYTTFFCASGNITAQPLLAKSRVDILGQLTPVGMVATAPHVLVVSAKLPVHTVGELVAYAKAHPGTLNFGSAGVGGLAHLGTELFARAAGISITHVPYKGAAQAMTDLVSGQVQGMFGTMPSFTGMIEKGAIRALGITAPSGATPLKNLPLIARTVPGFQYSSWNGIFVPVGTPAPLIEQLYIAMAKGSTDKGLAKRFDEQGVDIALANSAQLAAAVHKEIAVWDKVIRDAKIALN
ncbi:tripartite tricarboxylate transporter substrate-binding protein [Variovorax sp. J22G21]|uniref:Bug family tripartite tricarboxylate transporter substrate binding protein n=1 Tax=Variovorax fucosicus TaxID=3053517 RepID=UPI002575AE9F|nr:MULTISPECIES: tripartite tricarboxylate transporter substrate-binding protein [unclassified Variovorax]MDM0039665.1 tripartite tricarboxylate transporter substrate-binding protein [Variovorax sp. J22R193]MDM0064440.1 tripartite tricarboxylate transporter substrate-binding protein [Variovorax sp. J22G21]